MEKVYRLGQKTFFPLYGPVFKKEKTLWPLFMDVVQLPKGYRATTTRRQFSFYH